MRILTSGALAALVALSACGEKETILQGARESILPETAVAIANSAPALNLSGARTNASWTHRMGESDHSITHPALAARLNEVFAVQFGAAVGKGTRISADPIVAGGRVFVMDAASQVVALTTGGQPIWTRALVPPYDTATQASGGGIAYGDGKVFATSGFGELTAIDPATGRVLWTQDLDAPGGSAPTVRDGLVYIAARDGTAWAINTETGRIAWTLRGAPGVTSFGAGVGPAVTGDLAIMPFPGGELRAVFAKGGLARWSSVVAGGRTGYAATLFSDITADPVVSGNTVYAGNIAGRAAAVDLGNGETRWSIPMAAKGPMQPAGNSVFLVNDLNQLVRVSAATGDVIWQIDLPKYAETRRNNRYYAHFGPILAGGRLIVASSDGVLRQFDPRSGSLVGSYQLSAPAAALPAVAGGVLYVVTTDAKLHAFR